MEVLLDYRPNHGLKPTDKPLGEFCNTVSRKESGRIFRLSSPAVLAVA